MASQDYHCFLFGAGRSQTSGRVKPSDIVLSKIEINEPGFKAFRTIKPSTQTDEDELKFGPANNTDAYDKYFGDKADCKYHRVVLKCHRFEKLSKIFTHGDQARVVAPPKPKPSKYQIENLSNSKTNLNIQAAAKVLL